MFSITTSKRIWITALAVTVIQIFCVQQNMAVDENAKTSSKGISVSKTIHNPDFNEEDPLIRIKDMTMVKGVRENYLVGWGLVVGLNGTGDSLSTSPQTKESLVSMLERLGVNVRDAGISGKNVALVMVTATLPPFARAGSKIDVTVSTLGDAKSLNGGTLVVTALKGADGQVYAVAQGNIAVSGISAQGVNAQQTKGVPTSGRIANGAVVEKEINFDFQDIHRKNGTFDLLLSNPDITTAKRIAEAINIYAKTKQWADKIANVDDMGTIRVTIPKKVKPLDLLNEIGHLVVRPDTKAKIVIDENNGVIAMNNHTRISPIALTHGSITIKIVEEPKVYMPNPASQPYLFGVGYPSFPNNQNTMASTTIQQNFQIPTKASFEDIAKKVQALKTLQAEQLRLLQEQQKNEKQALATKLQNDPNKDSLMTQLDVKHNQDLITMQSKFSQEIASVEQSITESNPASNAPSSSLSLQNPISQEITPTNYPNQMNPVMGPNTAAPVVTSQTDVSVREEKGKFSLLSSGASLDRFVNALNQLGVTVKDMGSILMAIKNAGALHAEIKLQ